MYSILVYKYQLYLHKKFFLNLLQYLSKTMQALPTKKLDPYKENTNIKVEYNEIGLVLSPSDKNHEYCLIWLHGLDYYPQRFLNFFLSEELIKLTHNFKIVIPQGPIKHSTLMKKETVSWYDIYVRDFSLPFEK